MTYRAYDDLPRLQSTKLKAAGGAVLNEHSFAYAPGTNWLTRATRTAGNTMDYSYDPELRVKP